MAAPTDSSTDPLLSPPPNPEGAQPVAEQPAVVPDVSVEGNVSTPPTPQPVTPPAGPSNSAATPTARSKPKPARERWQDRLLPLMRGMLIGLTIFFFIVTLIQMSYLHYTIQEVPPIDLGLPAGSELIARSSSFSEAEAARRLDLLSRLEGAVLERRYHQANAAMMSGLWLRYLGFVTGMILAMVGAAFILGKLQEPVSEVSGKGGGLDFSIRSASPGIILVVLGVVLMLATILDQDSYETAVKGIYLPDLPAVLQTVDSEIPVLGTYPVEALSGTPAPDIQDMLTITPP